MALMKELTTAIDKIAFSTKEQSSGVDELTRAVSQIEASTQQNSSTVEELAKTADNLHIEALELARMVELFIVSSEKSQGFVAVQDYDGANRYLMGKKKNNTTLSEDVSVSRLDLLSEDA
jgi:hypothetical protein